MDRTIVTIKCSMVFLALLLSAGAEGREMTSFSQPVRFEENRGQFPDDVRFAARVRGGTVFLGSDRLLFVAVAAGAQPAELRFRGANEAPGIEPRGELRMRTNYYRGIEAGEWVEGVRSFERVGYNDLYDGIDLELYGTGSTVELDLIVAPGADPKRISIQWSEGATPDIEGRELVLAMGSAELRLHAPVTYQMNAAGKREHLESSYRFDSGETVGFEVPAFDDSRPLVIDPVITFSSYLGGDDHDEISVVKTDVHGNVYLTGHTMSGSFLGVEKTLREEDLFVMKLSPEMEISFVTVFGGHLSGDAKASIERATDLAVDASGQSYVTGLTSSPDFPLVRAYQQTHGGGLFDAYIARFDQEGKLSYSTLLGGSGHDGDGARLAVDAEGVIHACFVTRSYPLPLVNPLQDDYRGRDEIFLIKLVADENRVLFSTYLGGSGSLEIPSERVHSLLLDGDGNIVLVGSTISSDFPVVKPIQSVIAGGYDVFVTKIAGDGSSILFSTFFGGSGFEVMESANSFTADLDPAGNIWIAANTNSPDLPLVKPILATPTRLFLAKLKGDGTGVELSTYLDWGWLTISDVEIDLDGAVFVAGSRVAKLGSEAQVMESYVVGGVSIAIDRQQRLYVTGSTGSSSLPLVDPIQDTKNPRGNDGFLVRYEDDRPLAIENSRVLPVVGSLPGSLGSFFRTMIQLHNPTDEQIGSRLVYHRSGLSGQDDDPSLDVWLGPGQTRSLEDLLPSMGEEGIGSVDLLTGSSVPLVVTRIFNDAGEMGTTGMSTVALGDSDVLGAGDSGHLIAPHDPVQARFNLGARTLEDGADVTITVRRANGSVAGVVEKSFGPDFFVQQTASDFLGLSLEADDSLVMTVTSGSLVLYGAATDNTSQDPSLQIARRPPAGSALVIPVAGSLPGAFGSFFRTTLQLHNPSAEQVEGSITFHPAGVAGSDDDPRVNYSIRAGETIVYADLLPAMGLGGIGSVDLKATSGALPVSVIRVFNDAGEGGTSGMTQEAMRPAEALSSGEGGILIAPADLAKSRFNIGVRTLASETSMTISVRNAAGSVVSTSSRTYPPNFFEQRSAEELLGIKPNGNDAITFTIESGAMFVYGATTDNLTQDPSLQVARSEW